MGAASLGMAGAGFGAEKIAASMLCEAVGAPLHWRVLLKGGAMMNRGLAHTANASSVGYSIIGTVSGGNLGSSDRVEDE
ncbi:hypothetical protein GCM10018787_49550 [Streptomyces thermodiastaticus]|jgi:hypothetical protein|nr:hypothetical protein GCM10018787_49550 [Streptomyces thermodiastaticus]